MELRVRLEKVLCDRTAGAGEHLVGKMRRAVGRVTLPRVVFGMGRDLDLPVRALCFTNETDGLGRVAGLARRGRAAGQIAAQGDDAADVLGTVGRQDFGNVPRVELTQFRGGASW